MSQSEDHIGLVLNVVNQLETQFPNSEFLADLPSSYSYRRTFSIDGFFPDVYCSVDQPDRRTIIAEAKTDSDIDNEHTWNQINAFIRYLSTKRRGLFVLSVTGIAADAAKVMLFHMSLHHNIVDTDIAIYDSLDFWYLDRKGRQFWHLH